MGTNFYRIPTEEEMSVRRDRLIHHINNMELSPSNIKSEFSYLSNSKEEIALVPTILLDIIYDWIKINPWDEFLNEMKIHLGKRSKGWKFVWNFNKNKYYSNKEELFAFIRSGRVIDEYGKLIPNEEFIKEALEWGQPDGHIYNEEYLLTRPNRFSDIDMSENYSKIIDGLVVSAHDEFC